MPYLNSLAQQYGLATHYYADAHPSIGNYFDLSTGQTVTNLDSYSMNDSVQVKNLVPFTQFTTDLANGTLPAFPTSCPICATTRTPARWPRPMRGCKRASIRSSGAPRSRGTAC